MPGDRPALPPGIAATGIVAVARAASAWRISAAAEALVTAGVTCLEVSLTTPGAIDCIASLVKTFGNTACIGAGTVVTAEQARACLDAGATYLVSPSRVPDVVRIAAAQGVPCVPGALTPTEIVACWHDGAAAVKLFPASLGGPGYLFEVRAPLPDIPLIATGGVSLDSVGAYIAAGAVALGLGGALFGDALDGGDLAALTSRGGRLLAAIAEARQSGNVGVA